MSSVDLREALAGQGLRRRQPTDDRELGAVPHGAAFWITAYGFAVAMAFSAAPTPLYGLYQHRDHWPNWVITVVFAAYAGGVVVSLLTVGHLSDWVGRRRILVPAFLVSSLACVLFIHWQTLPVLVVARVLSGVAVGAITATATSQLGELHRRSRPTAPNRRAELVSTAANLGGIGIGPLLSGVIADLTSEPLVLPYVVFAVLLLVAGIGISLAPETALLPERLPRYRLQRVAVPAAARGLYVCVSTIAFAAFAVFGLFTSLAPTLISQISGLTSHTVAGAVAFSALASGALAQIALARQSARRMLMAGLVSVITGLMILTSALSLCSVIGFITGGMVAGAGAGLLFKNCVSIVVGIAAESDRAEALAGLFLAGYLGLAAPIIGLGIVDRLTGPVPALIIFGLGIVAITTVGTLTSVVRLRRSRPTP